MGLLNIVVKGELNGYKYIYIYIFEFVSNKNKSKGIFSSKQRFS